MTYDTTKAVQEFDRVFKGIGVERPEFQILWRYGNPMKRIIHDVMVKFFKSSLLQAYEAGKRDGEAYIGKTKREWYSKGVEEERERVKEVERKKWESMAQVQNVSKPPPQKEKDNV